MFCTNCGASTKNGADLCANCGESLTNNQIEDRLSRLRALNDAPSSSKFDALHTLFDFSFHRPATTKTIKFLYNLSILFATWMTLFFILVGFETSPWLGILALLVGAPVVFLLIVTFNRVILEMFLVISRKADHAADTGMASVKGKAEPREGIQWNV